MFLMVVLCSPVSAAGTGRPSAVLHLHFGRVVTRACAQVMTSRSYTLIPFSAPRPYASCAGLVLLNDRTGARKTLIQGGYVTPIAFGMPWVVYDDNLRPELENVITGKHARFRYVSGIGPEQIRIGSHWVEHQIASDQPCSDGHVGCGPPTYRYDNLKTGRYRSRPQTSSTRILDLNSPTLTQSICPPLQVPPGGVVNVYPPFAVLSTSNGSFLERCGTRLHKPVGAGGTIAGDGLFASHTLVLWTDGPPATATQAIGVQLPSLAGVTLTLPQLDGAPANIAAMDDYRLYVESQTGAVWSAALPYLGNTSTDTLALSSRTAPAPSR